MTASKPLILMDMDGPLANFDKRFYELCHEEGIPLHDGAATLEQPCTLHRFASDCIEDKAARARTRQVVQSSGWFESLEPTYGAVEGMEMLSEKADVWICTKPLEANLTCRDEKAAWVRDHLGSEWERKLIITPNKGMVNGNILVDDAIKLSWMAYATWKPVVFTTPWNGTGSDWEPFPHWTWPDPGDKYEKWDAIHALIGLCYD